jgi:hypothetical protein
LLFSQQIDCKEILFFLEEKETIIKNLNLHDPDLIPLHFLIAKDITKELVQFKKDVIPFFTGCEAITFSELINKYDELTNSVQLKYDSLLWLNSNVYLIFYEKALNEYQFNNEEDGDYYLQRSLQYNDTYPNAILLKLNKLLSKNCYEESLSLLNTLYYETQMERSQEIEAIEFTDKFYSKLYFTADSLVKIEHAAEALQLFEVLETFCLNLPSSYCNDDYFHGVLRSRSGIYDSYIAIAKVAEKRGNSTIAIRFFQYAQEYLETNPYLKNYEPIMEEITEKNIVNNIANTVEKTDTIVENSTILVEPTSISDEEKVIVIEEIIVEEQVRAPLLSSKEVKDKYDAIVLQALALCIKEDFSGSYKMFSEAKQLEDCLCFKPDFRVDMMLKNLSEILE